MSQQYTGLSQVLWSRFRLIQEAGEIEFQRLWNADLVHWSHREAWLDDYVSQRFRPFALRLIASWRGAR